MKLISLFAFIAGTSAFMLAPAPVQRAGPVAVDRRGLLEKAAPAAAALLMAPAIASAAKPPQLQSMTPPRPPKTGTSIVVPFFLLVLPFFHPPSVGQIKTGNAGSILKK